MNRMASQVLTSALKTAASASVPMSHGSDSASSVGSDEVAVRQVGMQRSRAAMPSSSGTNAKSSWATPAAPMPRRTARALAPP